MTNPNFDNRLMKILEKEVMKERWKKKLRVIGVVLKKKATRKGSYMINIKTKKSQYDVVIPQYKAEEFQIAKDINEGDIIKIIGDKQVGGIVFCDKIEKITKEKYNDKKLKILN